MLFTLLGVIALVLNERRKVNNIDSGEDENLEQSDVPRLWSPDGQTSQHISSDSAVLSTAEEPLTRHPEVHEDWSDEALIQDSVEDLSERSVDVHSCVLCKWDIDSLQTVSELVVDIPTTEEPITGDLEVNLVKIPEASESPTEDTVVPQSCQLEDNETTAFAMNIPSVKDIKYIRLEDFSEALLSELQDQPSEETYDASITEIKSDSGVSEGTVPPDDTPESLNTVLSGLSQRWRNCWVKGTLTLAMIAGIFCSIYQSPVALMAIVLCVQIKCFHDMMTIGYLWHHLPWFSTLSWYFLLSYFLSGETLTDNFFTLMQREEPIRLLSQPHGFIPFVLYLTGFCMFALSLVKRRCLLQFYMLGWTLMILASLSQLIIRKLIEGMIWFIVPISYVLYNGLHVWLLFWSHSSLQDVF